MKIVQVINSLSVADGGPSRNSFELNISLNKMENISADLFWLRGPMDTSVLRTYNMSLGALPVPGPLKVGCKSRRVDRVSSVAYFLSRIRHCDVVVIHGYYLIWLPFLALIIKSLKRNFVITPHGSLTHHQQQESKWRKAIFDRTLGPLTNLLCSGFITGSSMEAEELRRKFPHVEVSVAGVGTSIPNVYRQAQEWSNPLRLLSLSRIAPKKRLDICIDAVASLIAAGIQVQLDIVGTGDAKLTEDLKIRVRELNVDQFINFHGQLSGEDKSRMFLNSDIFLLPSDDENFGIGLAEALAHGLPCVTSSGVAAASAMSPGTGKVLVAPTGHSVATAVMEIVSNFDPYETSQTSRLCAATSFSWATAADRWGQALNDLKKSG